MVTREICLRLCAACQSEALATAILSSRDLSDISAQNDEHTDAKPYHSAYKRVVKIIGATSHYVTAELDAGPIIEQDVNRVSHTHSINDLVSKGRDLEKIVLSTGIKLHLERKVMVYNNKTVIFS